MRAVSAVALSAGVVFSGATVVQLAATASAEAATVNRVEVRGNRRVDAETIRNQVGIQPGESFTSADVNEAVKRLFATGLFADVSVTQSGSTLVVTVDEYAIVNQVLFQGNSKIKDQNLTQAVQLQPRGAFSNQTMQSDAEAIREAYRRIGRDDATVTGRVEDLSDGRVNVVFEIQEGERTKIAAVNFEGNEAFGDRRLRDVVSTKPSNPFSFLLRNDIYDENRLRADEEVLRRFYYNHGYADFRLISSTAELVDNKYTITFTVDEGPRYTFGEVAIDSTIPGIDTGTLRSELDTRSGAIYAAEDVESTIIGLTERLAGEGFAFAEVTPRGNRDFANRTISVVYSIDQGPRAYIQRIEIRGNTRTRDYVIRREFDLSEGDAFNQVLVQRAKRRLEGLNFFQTVNISTVPGSQPDQVVLVVDVVEKPTGEFSIGAGYTTGASSSSSGGFSVEGSVTERNFLGRGQFIRVAAAGGEESRNYSLSFTEPYFLGRRIAAGFDIFRNTRTFSNGDDEEVYDREVNGGTIRFGLPITEALTTRLAYHFTQEEYSYADDYNNQLSPYLEDAIDDGKWTKSSVSASLIYNTLDNAQLPREGIFADLTAEVAGLGGDAQFVKVTGRGSYYHTLSQQLDLVGMLSVGGGHITSFGDESLRIFDHFESNDRIIRGFKYNGIGPYDSGTDDHLGGTTYFHATAEAQFPMPILPESLGIRGAVFADAATLYDSELTGLGNVTGTEMEWRASVGASVIWASPFGPLRVDYAEPVVKETGDRIQHWNFGISTRF